MQCLGDTPAKILVTAYLKSEWKWVFCVRFNNLTTIRVNLCRCGHHPSDIQANMYCAHTVCQTVVWGKAIKKTGKALAHLVSTF
jgi:hypothetical protein